MKLNIEQLEHRLLMANDVYHVIADTTSLQSTVLANDGGAEYAALFLDAKYGHVEMNSDGTFSYTPNAGFVGNDGFLYENDTGDLLSVRLKVLPVLEPDHPGHVGTDKQPEHDALLQEVAPRVQADNVALISGDWSDPRIWSQGVPGYGQKVLIYASASVEIDVDTARLDWLRVDGHLTSNSGATVYANDVVGAPGSVVQITRGNFVATPGPVDDSQALSRGFIFHGNTIIEGEYRTSKVVMNDAFAGASAIILQSTPEDWQVGDEVLLAGPNGNEFRFITAIAPNAIQLDSPLANDYVRPTGQTFSANEVHIYVANITRSVTFRSEDPTQRGHFMLMHSPSATVKNAAFIDLGRTDKGKVLDDPASHPKFPGSGTNPRGRYALHLHRLGIASAPIEVHDNVVLGSPGWGIVHHDSAANLVGNIVYGVKGSGIVAEDGNETGRWENNLVVNVKPSATANAEAFDLDDNATLANIRAPKFDFGFTGSGYWVQGSGHNLQLVNNVAADVVTGMDVFGRIDTPASHIWIEVAKLVDGQTKTILQQNNVNGVLVSDLPVTIDGLEVYNSRRAIHTWMLSRDTGTGGFEGGTQFTPTAGLLPYSSIRNIVAWDVRSGIQNFYSAKINHENILVIGNPQSPIPYMPAGDSQGNNGTGVALSHNQLDAHKLNYTNVRAEGFAYAAVPPAAEPGSFSYGTIPSAISTFDGISVASVNRMFLPIVSAFANEPFTKLFALKNVSTTFINNKPSASYTSFVSSTTGKTVFDGSSSYAASKGPQVTGNGIVAYKWDVDGQLYWGDKIAFVVPPTNVQLTVYDDRGVAS